MSQPSPSKRTASSKDLDLPRITLVTGNKGKLAEVQAILAGSAIIDAHRIDLPELQGECAVVITREKAKTAFEILKVPVVIEDTSLCFDALGGLPGPYIKWFKERIGNDGLVKMLSAFDDKTAHAQCIFALCEGPRDEDTHVFVGTCRGVIVPQSGDRGFGWDPIFLPDEGGGKTFADMEAAEKNRISHRSRALALLRTFFSERHAAAAADETLQEKRMRQ